MQPVLPDRAHPEDAAAEPWQIGPVVVVEILLCLVVESAEESKSPLAPRRLGLHPSIEAASAAAPDTD